MNKESINFLLSTNKEKIELLSSQLTFDIFDAIMTNEKRLKNLKKLLDE